MSNLTYVDLSNVRFNNIMCSGSAYGVIWSGIYRDLPCVIKMLSLKNGIHYNKDSDTYHNRSNKILPLEEARSKYYSKITNQAPFIHKYFFKKRSVTYDAFVHEITQGQQLQKLDLSPKIYEWGCSHTIDGFRYGFIIMEKYHSNIKEVRMARHLTKNEKQLIEWTINKLHDNNFVHGDMKPNNMGVLLDPQTSLIYKCCFFDWYTVKNINEMNVSINADCQNEEEKQRLKDKDFHTYKTYYSKIKHSFH